MRAEEIKDAESLQAWLESLPQKSEDQRGNRPPLGGDDCASRGDASVSGVIGRLALDDGQRYQNYNTIAVLRCNLLSELLAGNLDRRIVPVCT